MQLRCTSRRGAGRSGAMCCGWLCAWVPCRCDLSLGRLGFSLRFIRAVRCVFTTDALALSPLRFGALRSASAYPLCRGEGCQTPRFLSRSGLSPRHAERLSASVPCGVAVFPNKEVACCRIPRTPRLVFNTMLPGLWRPFSLGYFRREASPRGIFWASKRKVTRPPAGGRNARCVSGQVAITCEAAVNQ